MKDAGEIFLVTERPLAVANEGHSLDYRTIKVFNAVIALAISFAARCSRRSDLGQDHHRARRRTVANPRPRLRQRAAASCAAGRGRDPGGAG